MEIERVGVDEAGARLPELIDEVRRNGKSFVIEEQGKPVSALVRADFLESQQEEQDEKSTPGGILALVGAFDDIDEDIMNNVIDSINRVREEDRARLGVALDPEK